ncbi:hypothetical protein [Nocardia sp. NPDC057353]|uniref:hypothetical protein n=1 Tax=Nocardia sp. NPDC057353 TaxID=3346104 RepID=UPI003645EECB
MAPTETQFRRLAQSSPWRWRSAGFTWRTVDSEPFRRARVVRPDTVRIEHADGTVCHEHRAARPFDGSMQQKGDGPWEPVPGVWPADIVPEFDADGLVANRPADFDIDFGHGTYFENYHWVAMLDPAEFAGPVELTDLAEVEHAGRPAWQATALPLADYDPRCPCCPLLRGHFEDENWVVDEGPATIRLDVATGICVSVTYGPGRLDLEVRIAESA